MKKGEGDRKGYKENIIILIIINNNIIIIIRHNNMRVFVCVYYEYRN